jgi:hypothetical protein
VDEVSVIVGSRIEWVDHCSEVRLITRVINPMGPTNGSLVETIQVPPPRPQPKAKNHQHSALQQVLGNSHPTPQNLPVPSDTATSSKPYHLA